MLDSDIKNCGEITVIQLLRRARVFFESDAFRFVNTGKRDELHRHHSTAVIPDRFAGNDGAVARDLARRSLVVQTDRIVFDKPSLPLSPLSRFTAQLLFEQTGCRGRNSQATWRADQFDCQSQAHESALNPARAGAPP